MEKSHRHIERERERERRGKEAATKSQATCAASVVKQTKKKVADDGPQTKTDISFSKSLFVFVIINTIDNIIIMNKMGKNRENNLK